MTIDGSMFACLAMARMVARSYPSAAKRSRAAVRMAARVVSERREADGEDAGGEDAGWD
jgi:hypothetical protein